MTAATPANIAAALEELKRELQELRGRVAALERLVGSSGEHAEDRSVVRGKVSYDWQG